MDLSFFPEPSLYIRITSRMASIPMGTIIIMPIERVNAANAPISPAQRYFFYRISSMQLTVKSKNRLSVIGDVKKNAAGNINI